MKIIKIFLLVVVLLLLIAFACIRYFSEDIPLGQTGKKADEVAVAMLERLNKDAFDKIAFISFEFFSGGHKYIWDKHNNRVIISWDKYKVVLNLENQNSAVFDSAKIVQDDVEAEKIKQKAWSYWCNDSFWLAAPFKVFDPGTTRKLVDTEEGTYGLLIEYTSGGVTPGDSYLWILDDFYQPLGFKMWTQILPLKGMYVDWKKWDDYNGSKLCLSHTIAGKQVNMKNVKVSNSLEELQLLDNPFNALQ